MRLSRDDRLLEQRVRTFERPSSEMCGTTPCVIVPSFSIWFLSGWCWFVWPKWCRRRATVIPNSWWHPTWCHIFLPRFRSWGSCHVAESIIYHIKFHIGLLKTHKRNNIVLVIVDHLTKSTHFLTIKIGSPLKNTSQIIYWWGCLIT